MKSALLLGLLLASGCATTLPTHDRIAQREEPERRCLLVGTLASHPSYNPRSAVLDETTSIGPTKIVWIIPPTSLLMATTDGLLYRCEGTL